jgi:hypothetical protein
MKFDNMSTFEDWKREVDREVERRIGLSSDDLPDYCYRDAYDAGDAPEDVAIEVLAEAGFEVE